MSVSENINVETPFLYWLWWIFMGFLIEAGLAIQHVVLSLSVILVKVRTLWLVYAYVPNSKVDFFSLFTSFDIVISVILSFFVVLVSFFNLEFLLTIFGATKVVLPYASDYMRIILLEKIYMMKWRKNIMMN